MHQIKHQFELTQIKNAAFDLDVAFHRCQNEFVSAENTVIGIKGFFFLLIASSMKIGGHEYRPITNRVLTEYR